MAVHRHRAEITQESVSLIHRAVLLLFRFLVWLWIRDCTMLYSGDSKQRAVNGLNIDREQTLSQSALAMMMSLSGWVFGRISLPRNEISVNVILT